MVAATLAALTLLGGSVPASAEKQAENLNIPPDTPERFLERYRYFIPRKEEKPIKKLNDQLKKLAKKEQTDAVRAETARLTAERDALIAAFWASRDTDPATPENEFKQLVDDRIADITDEWFFSNTDIPGLLFRSNGGFFGDMSRVFQVHGPPHVMGALEGQRFVNLMLWIYLDPGNGRVRYAFLFYERMGGSEYRLFPQDQYKMDPCGAIVEVMQFKPVGYTYGMCPEEAQMTYQEIARAIPRTGNLGSYIFIWAMQNVSEDPSEHQGTALEAPVAASVSARKSGARVAGEAPELTGTPETDYILSACGQCQSLIPAKLITEGSSFTAWVRRKDLDWRLVGDQATAELKGRVLFEHVTDPGVLVVQEQVYTLSATKADIAGDTGDNLVPIVLVEAGTLFKLRPGWYRVSVYLKNTLKNKYAAWNVRYLKAE
jgi:GWxTD domain-containing protein